MSGGYIAESGPVESFWMARALERARLAASEGEVPVGALVVRDGVVLGSGCNATERSQDPTAHAEMIAIRQAAEAIGTRRFHDTALYVTLEPCAMCAGAIVLARIPRILFGAHDPKAGACGTLRNVVRDPRLNHTCQVVGGVLESECAGLLREFFSGLRSEGSAVRRGARVVEGGGLENRCGLHGHRGFESHPLRHPER